MNAQTSPGTIARIALVTDFGEGIYVGQMRARLAALVPALPTLDLVHDLPPFRPDLAAYLLPALVRDMPRGTLYLCVVDPGVGGERGILLAEADGDWYLAPDNGLLAPLLRRASSAQAWRLAWRPATLSASFHGRDWIAPAGAKLCLGEPLACDPLGPTEPLGADWPEDLPATVYVDRYGNAMTGLRAAGLPADSVLVVAGRPLHRARTFCDLPAGTPFWYENALGLVEIAVNRGRADRLLGLSPGDPVATPATPGIPKLPTNGIPPSA